MREEISSQCDCEREQGLEFVYGPDTTLIQNGSAAPIGASMFAFVETAKVFPNNNNGADFLVLGILSC
jgi:hypothetical protein